MRLLNLGCGYPRIEGEEWVNLDTLKAQLPPGSPELANLCAEQNYVEHDLSQPLPFQDNEFDGVLASHVFEHFDAQEGLRIMRECHRVLKSGGVLLVSVPDASYFRKVYPEDRVANWPRLFGQTDPENPIPTFFEAALWFDQHKAILTEDALWCYFTMAGFDVPRQFDGIEWNDTERAMIPKLNRRKFSVEMLGYKE
jgi:predicted SAM-dependent methyltransferase